MRDYIDVNTDRMPYSIRIPLGMDIFTMRFTYNETADLFTVKLLKGDGVITEAEPVIYGVPLFRDIYQAGRFPVQNIVPYDESGLHDEVTADNFGKQVRLTIDSGRRIMKASEIITTEAFKKGKASSAITLIPPAEESYNTEPTGLYRQRVRISCGGVMIDSSELDCERVKLMGRVGANVPMGFLVSTVDMEVIFYTTENITISSGGSEVTVACTTPGVIGNVSAGSIMCIVKPSADVESVEHLSHISAGEDVESDSSLRRRFVPALAGRGSSSIDAIRGAILRVPQVRGASVLENAADVEVGGLPPHSFACYVLAKDGNDQMIARAIFEKKPAGIQSVGDVEVVVQDASGHDQLIRFYKTMQKNIWIKISITVDASLFSPGREDEIRADLIDEIEKLANNETVYITSFYKQIYIDGVVNVVSLELSEDGSVYSNSDILCDSGEVARTEKSLIEIEVTAIG